MAMSIGDAILFLSADDQKLKKGLKGAEKSTHGSISRMSKSADTLQARFSKLSSGFMGIGSAVTAVTSGAIGMALKKWADSGDEIQKVSQRTGMSAQEVSRLRYAADLAGTSIQELEGNFTKLQKAVEGGSKSTVGALTQLGLSLEQVKAGTPYERLMMVLSGLSRIEDASRRSALSMALFGKSGTSTLNLIADGVDSLHQTMKEAPVVFTREQSDNAAAFNDQITKLKSSFEGLAQETLPTVAGALTSSMRGWTDFIQKISDLKKMMLHPVGLTGLFQQDQYDEMEAAAIKEEQRAKYENSLARYRAQQAKPVPPPLPVYQYDAPIGPAPGPTTPAAPVSRWQKEWNKGGEPVRTGYTGEQTQVVNHYHHETVTHNTISHANFTAGDDMIRAYNRKQAMRPGI